MSCLEPGFKPNTVGELELANGFLKYREGMCTGQTYLLLCIYNTCISIEKHPLSWLADKDGSFTFKILSKSSGLLTPTLVFSLDNLELMFVLNRFNLLVRGS